MSSTLDSVLRRLPSWMPCSRKDRERDEKKDKSLSETLKQHGKSLLQLWPYIWPKGQWGIRIRVILSLTCLFIAKIISTLSPFAYKSAVDTLSAPQFTFPVLAIFLYGFGRFMSGFLGDLRDTIFVKVQNRALQLASIDTFSHLHSLSLSYHLKRKTGSVLTGIDRGTRGIQFLTSFLLFNILPIILEVIMVSIALVVNYNPLITVITVSAVVFYVVFTIAVTEWRTKFRRAMNEQESDSKDKAVDSLLNFETVKYFGAEEHEIKRYNSALEKYSVANEKSQWSLAFLNVGQSFIIAIGQLGVMLITAWQVGQGKMTVGDFVLVNTFMLQLYTPLNFLGTSYRMIKQSLIDMEQMFDLLREEPTIRDVPNPIPCNVSKGEVVFENVHFSYNDKPVLKGVNFTLKPGKQLAIVGPSGAGKSTITKLLYRLYEPSSGSITIDGIDISQVEQSKLRQRIGIVPQDCVLFNDTIKYNIQYGNLDAGDDQVAEAARVANIINTIENMSEGWNTKVGERGLRLSGGEKQRVAIARVVLKDPVVLVCDEATSALDTNTEREIQENLKDLFKNKTSSIILAHRLSTIVDSDEIIVLKDGVIAERGTHDDLLALNGEYARLWYKQTKQDESVVTATSPVVNAAVATTPAASSALDIVPHKGLILPQLAMAQVQQQQPEINSPSKATLVQDVSLQFTSPPAK